MASLRKIALCKDIFAIGCNALVVDGTPDMDVSIINIASFQSHQFASA